MKKDLTGDQAAVRILLVSAINMVHALPFSYQLLLIAGLFQFWFLKIVNY